MKKLNNILVCGLLSIILSLSGCTTKSRSDNAGEISAIKEITQTTIVQPTQSPATKDKLEWQGHGMRVLGVIVKVDKDANSINSISLKVTNNLLYPGNPVDYDLKGDTIDIYFF